MKLLDIHAHLDNDKFKQDLDKVIENSRKAGVKLIITSGVNSRTNKIALEISEKYDIVKPSFGIYPLDALASEIESGEADGFSRSQNCSQIGNSDDLQKPNKNIQGFLRDIEEFDLDKELSWIEKNQDKCIAIGEAGMDFKFVKKEQEQKATFQRIIDLAIKLDKPLIVHSRKAELQAIELLEKSKIKKVVMHCFNGKTSLIERARDLGYYFSIPPIINRLEHFQMLVSLVPIEQLLTETDCPYLSPIPGERNEPANVKVTIKEIAKIKQISEQETADTIFNNAKTLFKI